MKKKCQNERIRFSSFDWQVKTAVWACMGHQVLIKMWTRTVRIKASGWAVWLCITSRTDMMGIQTKDEAESPIGARATRPNLAWLGMQIGQAHVVTRECLVHMHVWWQSLHGAVLFKFSQSDCNTLKIVQGNIQTKVQTLLLKRSAHTEIMQYY